MMKELFLNTRNLSLKIIIILFFIAYIIASILFQGFFSLQVFLNLLIDNVFLIIGSVGMAFVIISGGIDLSIGGVIAFTTMLSAVLLQKGVNAFLVIAFVLLIGIGFGLLMGTIIHYFKVEPFIMTLAGMFLMRGLAFVISAESVPINNPVFKSMALKKIYFPGGTYININVIIALIVLAMGIYIAHYTKFGRNIYAIGGNEESAKLMGLPVTKTKIMVYGFSGFCFATAGIVFSLYMLSGNGSHANGLELEAIASVVIGGVLLTGGSGYIFGTFFGVLILGLIQVIIMFQGTLSSWWTKIVVGLLLFAFIVSLNLISNIRNKGFFK